MRSSTPAVTTTSTVFTVGDYVLYRDPALFWAGKPGHTTICRVAWAGGHRYTLEPVTGGLVREVQGDYLRLLPPIDAMRDIDTATLSDDAVADGMIAGASAWLSQQHVSTEQRPSLPELPTQQD
ncbi:hypothetical protein ACH4C6_32565 [Streptomyces sp. NPDC017943]|uniref:hypothetical protein n=1 Tax=Streptomyces sp. NPDC017943 TaxID=3365019 RepID=UPI00379D2A36